MKFIVFTASVSAVTKMIINLIQGFKKARRYAKLTKCVNKTHFQGGNCSITESKTEECLATFDFRD